MSSSQVVHLPPGEDWAALHDFLRRRLDLPATLDLELYQERDSHKSLTKLEVGVRVVCSWVLTCDRCTDRGTGEARKGTVGSRRQERQRVRLAKRFLVSLFHSSLFDSSAFVLGVRGALTKPTWSGSPPVRSHHT